MVEYYMQSEFSSNKDLNNPIQIEYYPHVWSSALFRTGKFDIENSDQTCRYTIIYQYSHNI